MKAYTSIEQSKKLAKILPLETADMDYIPIANVDGEYSINVNIWNNDHIIEDGWIPCWSLATLLDYLSPNFLIDIKNINYKWKLDCRFQVIEEEELVDACYEMIIKLHEQKVL